MEGGSNLSVSKEKVEEMIRLYESMSIDKIARLLGVSRHTVNKSLKDSGIQLRPTGARKGYNKGEKIK